MKEYIEECTSITKSKGFEPSNTLGLQCVLIASEVAEAMENLNLGIENEKMQATAVVLQDLLAEFEENRKSTDSQDDTRLNHEYTQNFLEELADVCIRVFSLVGDMDLIDEFMDEFELKMQKNRKRQKKHGKKF